jgi:hypothetical protein
MSVKNGKSRRRRGRDSRPFTRAPCLTAVAGGVRAAVRLLLLRAVGLHVALWLQPQRQCACTPHAVAEKKKGDSPDSIPPSTARLGPDDRAVALQWAH